MHLELASKVSHERILIRLFLEHRLNCFVGGGGATVAGIVGKIQFQVLCAVLY